MQINAKNSSSLPGAVRIARNQHRYQQHACDKSPDIREQRYSALGHLRIADGHEAAEELDDEPIHQKQNGGDLQRGDEEKYRDQSDNAGAWELDQIRPHHSRNRAAGTNRRNSRERVEKDMDQGRG